MRFIEDNWLTGKHIGGGAADATAGTLDHMFSFRQKPNKPLLLTPTTGEPQRHG